jgi:hypothetical protein
MTQYTVTGELDLGDGYFAPFAEWTEGKTIDEALDILNTKLYEVTPGLQHWEMHFLFEGHHKDMYPHDEEVEK